MRHARSRAMPDLSPASPEVGPHVTGSGLLLMSSGIAPEQEPATESHVVSRGTPVAPCRPKAQRKRITRVGSPRSPEFPNYHELIEEPQHHEAAGNSLTAKGREHT